MVSQSGLSAGEWVLIHAVGSGVGTAAVQIAEAIGARSIGTSRTSEKIDRVKEFGLNEGLLVKETKFAEQVRSITGGAGVNVVLELVGGDYVSEDLDCIAIKGRIIIVGLLAGAKVDFHLGKLLTKRAVVRGTTLRARPLEEKIIAGQLLAQHIVPLIEAGKIRPVIDKVFELADSAKAHAYMESDDNFGKIILRVGD
jgi:NADPH:quinone reductase-like Zn-dependent oxidoreductase